MCAALMIIRPFLRIFVYMSIAKLQLHVYELLYINV